MSHTFSVFGLLLLDVGTKAIILIDKESRKKYFHEISFPFFEVIARH